MTAEAPAPNREHSTRAGTPSPEPSIAPRDVGFLSTLRAAAEGELPARYALDFWDRPFRAMLNGLLEPGIEVLDIGAGARPILVPDERPDGCTYVGLDVSAEELHKAPAGSYDEFVVADARSHMAELDGRFDLIVSWLAMEHIKPLEAAMRNARAYLRPGGHLLVQVPGRFSPFSLLNRILPPGATKRLLRRAQDRDPGSVFPAYYDRCSYRGLWGLLRAGGWTELEVRPLYAAAGYVRFSRLLTAAYLGYEELIYRGDRRDLAPYYLVHARRAGE